jgi:PAS domain S-box-containing protein
MTPNSSGRYADPALIDLFAGLTHRDPASPESPERSLPWFAAKVIEHLHLEACVVLVSRPQSLNVVARAGLNESELGPIMEQIKDCDAEVLTGDSPGERPSRAEAQGRCWTLEDRSAVRTLFRTALADNQFLWTVFVTSVLPSEELRSTMALTTIHLAKVLLSGLLADKVRTSEQGMGKLERELKEMHVCSLNIMEDLQKRNRDLAMLNSISQDITSRTSLPELARAAVEGTVKMLETSEALIYVLDEDRKVFVPLRSEAGPAPAEDFEVGPCDPAYAAILEGRETSFASVTGADCPDIARRSGAKAGLVIPLRSKDRVTGFLMACETRWHRVFTAGEIENLRVLANTLAVALENASLLNRTENQYRDTSSLKEYIETVLDSVDFGVMVLDADLTITVFSKGLERLYGQKRQDFVGRHVFDAYPGLLEEGFGEISEQVLGGKPFERSGWHRKTQDGRSVVQNIRILPHRDAEGRILGGIVIIEDVTDKANLKERLAKTEAKFSLLVENLDLGYMIVSNGRIVYANKAAAQLSGIPAFRLLGSNPGEVIDGPGADGAFSEEASDKLRLETRIKHTGGTCIPVEIRTNPCEYAGSPAVAMLIRDITERRKFEKEIELRNRQTRLRNEQITRLNQELEETVNKLKESQANLVKSERAAAITETSVAANHEINNPLFAILGQAQLLLLKYQGEDSETVQRIKTIEESALRIACVTKKFANLADHVVDENPQLNQAMDKMETPCST